MQIPKFLNFLNKNNEVHESQQKLPFAETLGIMPQEPENDDADDAEKISGTTKIKVIAAFLIVGLAVYVAYWVQEPSEYKAQLLMGTEEVSAVEMVAQAQTEETVPTGEVIPPEAVVAPVEAPIAAIIEPPAQTETAVQTGQDLSTQEVSIIDFNYDPPEIKVPLGGTLVWTNKDAVPHTISGLDFTSGTLNPGDSFSYIFAEEGTFDYACALHPQMKGRIIVGSGVSALLNQQTEQIVPVENITTITTEPIVTEPTALLPDNFGIGGDQLITSADIQKAHAAAEEQATGLAETKDLAKSGPEDLLYVGAFGLILFLNRKKILLRSR
jgi:plastocyanin